MKIGIFTHYYNSKNYGGNLQAYALVKVIEDLGYQCEQISYNRSDDNPFRKDNSCFIVKILREIRRFFINIKKIGINKKIKERNTSIESFNKSIPHSIVVTKSHLNELWKDYDVFITGSDQVWHPSAVCDGYLLNFDTHGRIKIAYAASFAVHDLPRKYWDYYRNCLSDFQAISVREDNGVKIIAEMCSLAAEWVLDPTLLLSEESWNSICNERKIKENYVFCFFLGESLFGNKKILEFAQKRNLKVVTMPYLTAASKSSSDFGDYRLFDVTPQDFISFIKNANYIFTDSFHAVVFSHIFKKEFFVFNRKSALGMNDRIYSLTSLFDTQDRFCDKKEKASIEYIESLSPIDYNKSFPKYEEAKEKSLNFLKDNLKSRIPKLNKFKN